MDLLSFLTGLALGAALAFWFAVVAISGWRRALPFAGVAVVVLIAAGVFLVVR